MLSSLPLLVSYWYIYRKLLQRASLGIVMSGAEGCQFGNNGVNTRTIHGYVDLQLELKFVLVSLAQCLLSVAVKKM